MNADFDLYIKLVGIKKVKNDLKASLSEATVKEQWNLIHEITDFIQSKIDKYNCTFERFTDEATYEKNIEVTENDRLSEITNQEIFEKCQAIIAEQLELSTEQITPESIIFRQYGKTNYRSIDSNYGVTDYSSVRYKYKNHWLVGLAQGLSGLASCGVSDSTMECNYYSDFGCDNLDFIELIMAVEEEFDIEIPDEQSEMIITVQDLYKTVVSNLNSQE